MNRRPAVAAVAVAGIAVAAASAAQTVDAERPRTFVVGTPVTGARAERIDAARTGRSAVKLPAGAIKSQWRTPLAANFDHAPLVDAAGTTYVVGTRGEVFAVSRDGSERWSASTGATQPGPAALMADDTLVFVDASGTAIGIRDGVVRFRTRFGRSDPLHAAPVPLDDGGVVVATTHDLAALDVDGHERARATLPEPTTVPLVAAGGRILAVTTSGAVWAWPPGAPEPSRIAAFDGPPDEGAALVDEHTLVAVTSGKAHLVAVDLVRGTTVTRAVAPSGLWLGPPATHAGVVYFQVATPASDLAIGIDGAGTEVARVLLGSHPAAVAPDGGAVQLIASARTPLLVDGSGALAFATSDGRIGVASSGASFVLADACAPAVGQNPATATVAAVTGLAPLGPSAIVAACHSGTVLALTSAGGVSVPDPASAGEAGAPSL